MRDQDERDWLKVWATVLSAAVVVGLSLIAFLTSLQRDVVRLDVEQTHVNEQLKGLQEGCKTTCKN